MATLPAPDIANCTPYRVGIKPNIDSPVDEAAAETGQLKCEVHCQWTGLPYRGPLSSVCRRVVVLSESQKEGRACLQQLFQQQGSCSTVLQLQLKLTGTKDTCTNMQAGALRPMLAPWAWLSDLVMLPLAFFVRRTWLTVGPSDCHARIHCVMQPLVKNGSVETCVHARVQTCWVGLCRAVLQHSVL
jgi:hypothetical protein